MVVWGFTAAVLDRVLEMAGWAVSWDETDVRELPRRAADLADRGVRVGPGGDPAGGADDGPAAEDVLPADHRAPGPGGPTAAPGTVGP